MGRRLRGLARHHQQPRRPVPPFSGRVYADGIVYSGLIDRQQGVVVSVQRTAHGASAGEERVQAISDGAPAGCPPGDWQETLDELELLDHAGDQLEVEFRFECLLAQQECTLTAATQYFDGSSQDWLDDVLSFRVVDPRGAAGVASFRTDIQCRKVTAS